MSRRRRVVRCPCGEPVRRVLHARYCSRCWGKLGRPQVACSSCGVSFSKDTMMGRRCRPCVSKAAHAKRVTEVYGITADQYARLLDSQQGACAICRRRPQTKRLAVDHRHADGVVRGLLCRNCNRNVVGGLREEIAAFERAIDYLQNPPAIRVIGRVVAPDVTRQQGES